jgi:nucleotide-binding universal stress UspA family protein
MVPEDGRRSVACVTDPLQSAPFKRIVVGVDGCDGGRDALALAAVLRRLNGGELLAVRVHPYERNVDLAHAERDEAILAERLRIELEHELTRAHASARTIVVTENSPGTALHAIAARNDAQLIVVGPSHLAGSERFLAGDDATGTLHGTRCAVAIAPDRFARGANGLRVIGVGIDCSDESWAALELARDLARRGGAIVHATTVAPAPEDAAAAWSTADELLQGVVADADADVALDVAIGTPWKELAARSAGLDLLVVGSRGHGPLRRLLLGSTSTKLARKAACPLLVVPSGWRRVAGEALRAVQA